MCFIIQFPVFMEEFLVYRAAAHQRNHLVEKPSRGPLPSVVIGVDDKEHLQSHISDHKAFQADALYMRPRTSYLITRSNQYLASFSKLG